MSRLKMESLNTHCLDHQPANITPPLTHCDLPDGMLQTVRAPDKNPRIGTWISAISRILTVWDQHVHGEQTKKLWFASIRIGLSWLRPESRERRVQFALWWHHLSHTNTHSNIQITLGVRVASKCYARAPPLRHVYTVGKKQYLCSTIGMFWENNTLECPLHYWLVRCERHESVWVWRGCMNMLHKDHMYVVQEYKS